MTTETSPTADATRLVDVARPSPTANKPGIEVAKPSWVTTKPLASRSAPTSRTWRTDRRSSGCPLEAPLAASGYTETAGPRELENNTAVPRAPGEEGREQADCAARASAAFGAQDRGHGAPG